MIERERSGLQAIALLGTIAAVTAGLMGWPPAGSARIISASGPSPIQIATAATLPSGGVQVVYSWRLTASGGTPPYIWSLTAGQLPSGLTLTAATGDILGTPTVAGTFSFTAQVKDSVGAKASTNFTLVVIANSVAASDSNPIQITTAATLPSGGVQGVYSWRLTANGGTPPYTWSLTTGQLPNGLKLTAATGDILGTPTVAGSYLFTMQVMDSVGTMTSRKFTVVVGPAKPAAMTTSAANSPGNTATTTTAPTAPPTTNTTAKTTAPPTTTPTAPAASNVSSLQITTESLPSGGVSSTYSWRLSGSGGTPPYTWSTTAGQLPAGLKLTAATGDVLGTPTLAGSFSFTMQVKDSKAAVASRQFSMTISTAPAPKVSGVTPNKGSVDGGTAVTISGSNFQPGSTVHFGNTPAAAVQVNSTTQIQAVAPAGPSGSVNVVVATGDGQTATAANAFTFAAIAANLPVETAESADAFVSTTGVNVHLNFTDTPYGNFTAVETALKNLGVRHIRDGLVDTSWTPYYDRLNQLGRDGIKATLITSPGETAALLTAYPARVADSFEAYEAPNEYDQSGDANWSATMNGFLGMMHSAIYGNGQASQFPILGPSLTQAASYPQVAPSSASVDVANLHNYMGGRNPGTPGWGAGGYGSIAWNMSLVTATWPGKPVITTETGYCNDLTTSEGVPEDVAGKYMPRIFLEQWLAGIERTYIYELVDVGSTVASNGYGLMHTDFTPKPAYTAMKNFLALLADEGPAFKPGGLAMKLSGEMTNVQHLLLQKRDGRFFLAVWVEQPGYDVNAKAKLAVVPQSVTLTLNQAMRVVTHSFDMTGAMQTTALGTGSTETISVCDLVTVLEISAQ